MSSAELYGKFEKSQSGLRKKYTEFLHNTTDEWVVHFPCAKDAVMFRGIPENNDIIIQEDGIFRISNRVPSRLEYNADFKELVDSVLQGKNYTSEEFV
jgi:hypothetical protein